MTDETVRRLNAAGLHEFSDYVISGGAGPEPTHLLSDPAFSEPLPENWVVDLDHVFADRFEFAEYVWGITGESYRRELEWDAGFWSWLALAYFQQFRPSGKLSKVYNYVFDPHRFHHYRHCAAMPVKLVRDFGPDARMFLSDSMSVMGDMLEQCMSRQYLMRSDTFVGVVKELYYDEQNAKLKSGAAGKLARKKNAKGRWLRGGAGSIRRFAEEVMRLGLTYNLEQMSPDEVISLLGSEYDRFRSANVPQTA